MPPEQGARPRELPRYTIDDGRVTKRCGRAKHSSGDIASVSAVAARYAHGISLARRQYRIRLGP